MREQTVPYIKPQENGNKTGVRWAALTNAQGAGLHFSGEALLEFTAQHFNAQDLVEAKHPHEIARRAETVVNLDYAQSGLGSASCGPGRLEIYKLPAEEARFQLRLRPV